MKNLQEISLENRTSTLEGKKFSTIIAGIFEEDLQNVRPCINEIDQIFGGSISRDIASGDFLAEKDETLVVRYADGTFRRAILAGLGKRSELKPDTIRKAMARALGQMKNISATAVVVDVDSFTHEEELDARIVAEILADATGLAQESTVDYKSEEKKSPRKTLAAVIFLHDSPEIRKGIDTGLNMALGTIYARTLASLPPNELNPESLAGKAMNLARKYSFGCTILDDAAIKKAGMGAFYAVGKGSSSPPRLMALDTRPKTLEKPLVLVGKGVTFDSGGISIKPSQNMHHMKSDMSGAAAVLGVFNALGRMNYQGRRIVGVVPSAENMPGGKAFRPSDVVTACDGTTIEILNTDAEGRLLLADAIAWSKEQFNPMMIIDVATLTGAITIALGNQAMGLFTNSPQCVPAMMQSGENTWERVWQLPVFDEYDKQLESSVADISNVGGREAGSSTAACFLKHFAGDTRWCHLDIAGMDWNDKPHPYLPKGPTGVGVRLLTNLILNHWPELPNVLTEK